MWEFAFRAGLRAPFRVPRGITRSATPAQRREIDAELGIARKGPYHGPFESAGEMAEYVDGKLSERRGARNWIGLGSTSFLGEPPSGIKRTLLVMKKRGPEGNPVGRYTARLRA